MPVKNTKKEYHTIVVGGGPSGMMAAGTAGARGKSVLLIEKNKRVGEKLRITGGGRCNITNNETDVQTLLKRYGKAEQFLYSAFSLFGVEDTFSFFTSRGLPLTIEAGNRVFPHTQNALDVVKVMEKYCKTSHVTILTNMPVERIIKKDTIITGVMAGGVEYACKSLVLATGGLSHPETGSTGDGFSWLQDLGHTISGSTPSLVPIGIKDAWVKNLAGLTLASIKIHFFVGDKKQFSKTGSVLFTHFGLSGPLILNAAKELADLLRQGTVTGMIDMYPDKDFHVLERDVLALFDREKNKTFKNICRDFVPAGMSSAVLSLLDASLQEKRVHSVTKEERKTIIHIFKALPFTVEKLMGYDRAIVADGGVVITEIDMRTMASNKYANLYMTGDLLNITRPSGGFSLQLCWTTGYVAGKNA